MGRETVTLHYDGPALEGHQMDVAYLAPALYALNDLVKVANDTFNGERASVRVLVNVDREQNSFEFGIEIVMSVLDQVRQLLHDHDVQNAKELAEWLGILGVPPLGVGLFQLFKWLRGRQPLRSLSSTIARDRLPSSALPYAAERIFMRRHDM